MPVNGSTVSTPRKQEKRVLFDVEKTLEQPVKLRCGLSRMPVEDSSTPESTSWDAKLSGGLHGKRRGVAHNLLQPAPTMNAADEHTELQFGVAAFSKIQTALASLAALCLVAVLVLLCVYAYKSQTTDHKTLTPFTQFVRVKNADVSHLITDETKKALQKEKKKGMADQVLENKEIKHFQFSK